MPSENEGSREGYSGNGVTIATWGMTGLLTDAAIAKYVVELAGGALYAVISQDAISKAAAKAPNGFDWTQLVADFDSLGGNVTKPSSPVPMTGARRS